MAAQPDFVNAVAALLTRLAARTFLHALRSLEASSGRAAARACAGARAASIWTCWCSAGEQIESPELTLPHPGIVQRNFVLYPLLEVAPDLNVPGCGRVAELASRVSIRRYLAPG